MPLTDEQELQIRDATDFFFRLASGWYGLNPEPPPVSLDLRGKAAGQWRIVRGQESLRFNPHIFARDWDQHFSDTVAHEVAHAIIYRRFGLGRRRPRPHGPEWQEIMRRFGIEPRVTHDTCLDGLPLRRSRRYTYECRCRTHGLGPQRHGAISRGQRSYHCLNCGERLVWTGEVCWSQP